MQIKKRTNYSKLFQVRVDPDLYKEVDSFRRKEKYKWVDLIDYMFREIISAQKELDANNKKYPKGPKSEAKRKALRK